MTEVKNQRKPVEQTKQKRPTNKQKLTLPVWGLNDLDLINVTGKISWTGAKPA